MRTTRPVWLRAGDRVLGTTGSRKDQLGTVHAVPGARVAVEWDDGERSYTHKTFLLLVTREGQ
jgi:hypothetical protein